jgi:pyridoxal phosphate enzyme (YggS family)
MTDEVASFAAARARVLDAIAAACVRSGRDSSSVTLVAVSKTVAVERIRAAVEAGLDRLGENRVQEAMAKIPAVPGASWELVGPLQANKARKALESFARIQSVDSVALAQRLDRIAGETGRAARYPVLLEVNVDADPAKSGFVEATLQRDLDQLLELPHLRVEGLMTIGRQVASAEAARPTFRALRALADRLRASAPTLGEELSMGMTDDYPVAVEEGATIVRVGRALFGERPHH